MTVIPLGGGLPREQRRARTARSNRGKLLYEDVIDLVERLIVEQDLQPGDMLPSQGELAELAQVSLITVRRALEELEREGRVRRHQGLGTFLARPKILSSPTRTGALGGTLDDGGSARVGTRLIGIEPAQPSRDVAAALDLGAGEQVWMVRRVRLLNGKPSIAERALIPVSLAPRLDEVFTGGSLYRTLAEEYGIEDDFEEQVLEVRPADAEVRALLRLPARAQVVRIRGLSRDQRGIAFDCFEQSYSATEFAFAIAGQTERRLQLGGLSGDWSARPLLGSDRPGRRSPKR